MSINRTMIGLVGLALIVAMVPSVTASHGGPFHAGTIVDALDGDAVPVLIADATVQICWQNADGDSPARYDPGESVYLHMAADGACGTVGANDVRLTAAGSSAAFTKVSTTDNDFGNALTIDPTGGNTGGLVAEGEDVDFYDADGNSFFNTGDTMYVDIDGDGTVDVGEVRLTPFGSFAAGSVVKAGDSDVSLGLSNAFTGVDLGICFWDLNGDGSFNGNDVLYLDISNAACNNPSVNDIRLSAHPGFAAGTIVGATDTDAVPVLIDEDPGVGVTTSTVQLCWQNADGDSPARYDPGEALYLHLAADDACGTVGANDVRLTAIGSSAAFSKVSTTDNDFGNALTEDPTGGNTDGLNDEAEDVDFYDADGNGFFNTGDTMYVDIDGDGTVDVGDVRLNGFGSFAAGSVVKAGDSDVSLGLSNAFTGVDAGICFWDLNGDGAYNGEDVLYLDISAGGCNNPAVNDVRLTAFGSLAAGNILSATDADAVARVTADTTVQICWQNADGDSPARYDPGEAVYLHMAADGACGTVGANDMRLTAVGSSAAFTKVSTTDNDFGNALTIDPAGGNTAGLAADAEDVDFYDADGNGFFNGGDTMYVDIDGDATVDVGEVRLTPFGSFAAGSVVKAGDSDVSLGLANAFTGVDAGICFWDLNGDGSFNGMDVLYLAIAAACTNPTVNDVRLHDVAGVSRGGGGATQTTTTTGTGATTATTDPTEDPGTTSTTGATQTTTTTGTSGTGATTGTTTPANTDDGDDNGAPGLGLVGVLAALGVALVLLRRRS